MSDDVETAMREAILADIRDRRLLKWLFRADADTNHVAIGYVEDAIDLETQHEMVDCWIKIVRRAALEEAAKVVQRQGLGSLGNEIASAIRALQDAEAE